MKFQKNKWALMMAVFSVGGSVQAASSAPLSMDLPALKVAPSKSSQSMTENTIEFKTPLHLDRQLMKMKPGSQTSIDFPAPVGKKKVIFEAKTRGIDGFYWHGFVQGEPESRIYLKESDKGFTGAIRLRKTNAMTVASLAGSKEQTVRPSSNEAWSLKASNQKGIWTMDQSNWSQVAQLTEGSELAIPIGNGQSEVIVITHNALDDQGFHQIQGISRMEGLSFPTNITVSTEGVFGVIMRPQGEIQITTKSGVTSVTDTVAAGWIKNENTEDHLMGSDIEEVQAMGGSMTVISTTIINGKKTVVTKVYDTTTGKLVSTLTQVYDSTGKLISTTGSTPTPTATPKPTPTATPKPTPTATPKPTPTATPKPTPTATPKPTPTPVPTSTSIPKPLTAGTVDTIIPVLVTYSNSFVNQWGSESAAKARISNIFALTNSAYANSGTGVSFKIVGWKMVNVADATPQTNLPLLKADSGAFAGVNALKVSSGAAMVSLFTPFNSTTGATGTCGLAYVPGAGALGVAGYAAQAASSLYSVLNDGQYSGRYCEMLSTAHELGHNLGAAHDKANSSFPGAFSYSYGKGVSGVFGSVMSYVQPKVALFSSPLLTCTSPVNGSKQACGSDTENVVATVLQTKKSAAALGKSTTTSVDSNTNNVVGGWILNSSGVPYTGLTSTSLTLTSSVAGVSCSVGSTGLYNCMLPATATSVSVTAKAATGKTVTPTTATMTANKTANTPVNGPSFYLK